MSSLLLYQFPGKDGLSLSPFVNKVHFALRIKKLQYETKTVLFAKQQSETGRLPVIAHDGKKVHDSTEIMRYLDVAFPERPLVPKDPRRAAEAHILEEWSDESFMPLIQYQRLYDRTAMTEFADITLPKVPAPIRHAIMSVRMGRTRGELGYIDEIGPEARGAQMDRGLDALETYLDSQPWLLGDQPTIADVAVGAAIHILVFFKKPIEPLSKVMARPKLKAWSERFFREVGFGHTH